MKLKIFQQFITILSSLNIYLYILYMKDFKNKLYYFNKKFN